MNNTQLNFSLRKDRLYGFRKACQAIHRGNQYILDSTMLKVS